MAGGGGAIVADTLGTLSAASLGGERAGETILAAAVRSATADALARAREQLAIVAAMTRFRRTIADGVAALGQARKTAEAVLFGTGLDERLQHLDQTEKRYTVEGSDADA